MKSYNETFDRKTQNRLQKVLDFLVSENENTTSISEISESHSRGWEVPTVNACGRECCSRKTTIKSKKTPRISKLLEPVLGNDIYLWNEKSAWKRYLNSEGNAYRPDNIFDGMDNEFLLLFDYDEGHDKKKNKNQKVYRRRYPNEFTLDPQEVKEELQDKRETINDRLKVFEENRAKKKFRKLTEKERQEIICHIRTEKIKKDLIHKMERYVLQKLVEQRVRIREAEKIKYEKKVDEFMDKIPIIEKERLDEMKEAVERVLAEERKKAELMKEALIGEELLITVDSTETEVKEKFEKFLMKIGLSELAEKYQLDMDAYCMYWKKKAFLLQIEREEEKKATKKERKLCEMQRKLEQLNEIEKYWKKEATESLKSITQKVREAVSFLPPMEKELKKLIEENEELENKIGYWKKIMPHYVNQIEKFVQVSFQDVPEKEILLKCLKKLEQFHEPAPPVVQYSSVDTKASELLIPSEEKEIVEAPKNEVLYQEYDFPMDLAHLYLSDGDFEETAYKLLQVKYIIMDLLRRVMPSEKSLVIEGEGKELEQVSSLSQDKCKSCSIEKSSEDQEPLISKTISEKLEEIIDIINKTFEVAGVKFSTPDFGNPTEFIEKRIKSINQIIRQ